MLHQFMSELPDTVRHIRASRRTSLIAETLTLSCLDFSAVPFSTVCEVNYSQSKAVRVIYSYVSWICYCDHKLQ